jgi:hypothetical protein
MKYFKNNRHKLFPTITDFSSPQNKFRNETNINKLTYKQWFWFHPSAYILISFGINIIAVILFTALCIYSVYRQSWIITMISGTMIIPNFIAIIKKYKNRKSLNTITFYDILVRDNDD